ncbi:PAX-interacting protein 1 [Hordeum vulgare]|nr:PAX-interacting protein 1 [Hordeum vulgare]
MEQGRGAAAAAHGDVVEDVEAEADVVQEVAAVGGAGDVARVVAGSVAAATDLEEKGVAGSDSAMPDLVVTASGDALDVRVEAGDKQVVDVEEEAVGMKRKLAMTGFTDPYESDSNVDDVYEYSGDDVDNGNKESFIEKEAQKIREKGKVQVPILHHKAKAQGWAL